MINILAIAQILICSSLCLAGYEDFFNNHKIHELDFYPMAVGAIIGLYYYPIFIIAEIVTFAIGLALWRYKLWRFADVLGFSAIPLLLSMQFIAYAAYLFVCICFFAIQLRGRGRLAQGYPVVGFFAISYILVWVFVLIP